jgi:protein-S-isoprenylcysteine O-methyltransferase Ste14
MKEKANFQTLLSAIMLIVAGMISPSNGVDERIHKTPLELITSVLVIVVIVITLYFIWMVVDNLKNISKRSSQEGK